MIFVRTLLLTLPLILIGVGCRSPGTRIRHPGHQWIEVDGFRIHENYWVPAREDVARRAQFDLDCPEDELEFTLMRMLGGLPAEIGVEGCGRGAAYRRIRKTAIWEIAYVRTFEIQRKDELDRAQR